MRSRPSVSDAEIAAEQAEWPALGEMQAYRRVQSRKIAQEKAREERNRLRPSAAIAPRPV